jgi:hypothetical protein
MSRLPDSTFCMIAAASASNTSNRKSGCPLRNAWIARANTLAVQNLGAPNEKKGRFQKQFGPRATWCCRVPASCVARQPVIRCLQLSVQRDVWCDQISGFPVRDEQVLQPIACPVGAGTQLCLDCACGQNIGYKVAAMPSFSQSICVFTEGAVLGAAEFCAVSAVQSSITQVRAFTGKDPPESGH